MIDVIPEGGENCRLVDRPVQARGWWVLLVGFLVGIVGG